MGKTAAAFAVLISTAAYATDASTIIESFRDVAWTATAQRNCNVQISTDIITQGVILGSTSSGINPVDGKMIVLGMALAYEDVMNKSGNMQTFCSSVEAGLSGKQARVGR